MCGSGGMLNYACKAGEAGNGYTANVDLWMLCQGYGGVSGYC